MDKKIIVIVGMHRSGTSVLARSMKIFGAQLGDRLLDPGPDNPKGYWEDEDIVNFDNEMLAFLGMTWNDLRPIDEFDVLNLRRNGYLDKAAKLIELKLKNHDFIAIKDPRMAKLLPIWRDAFEANTRHLMYVFSMRNPVSVIDSLQKRNNIDPLNAGLMWASHVIPALGELRKDIKCFIDYDELLENPKKHILEIANYFKLPVDFDELNIFLNEFLDKKLRHSFGNINNYNNNSVFFLCKDIYAAFKNNRINFIEKNLDQWLVEYKKLYTLIVSYQNEIFNKLNNERIIRTHQKNESCLHRKIQTMTDRNEELLEIITKKDEVLYGISRKENNIIKILKIVEELEKGLKKELIKNNKDLNKFYQIYLHSHGNLVANQKYNFFIKYKNNKAIRKSGLFDPLWYAFQIGINSNSIENKLINHYLNIGSRMDISPHPLFDSIWYANKNFDVEKSKIDFLLHYILYGENENRQPNKYFFPEWYLHNNFDLQNKDINLLSHYSKYGEKEGRRPNPYFIPNWYLSKHTDVAEAGISPLLHYIQFGENEDRPPCPYFTSNWYRTEYTKYEGAAKHPLHHFLETGERLGLNPNPYFWTNWYLNEYQNSLSEQLRPLEDYLLTGEESNKRPNPFFLPKWYLANNPDVKKAKILSLQHFIDAGADEGRDPGPYFDSLWYQTEYPQIAKYKLAPFVHYNTIGKNYRFSTFDLDLTNKSTLSIIPHYAHTAEINKKNFVSQKILISLFVLNLDSLPDCIDYLNNINFNYDLLISLPKTTTFTENIKLSIKSSNDLLVYLKSKLNFLEKIQVNFLPENQDEVTSLLYNYELYLKHYDIIGNFSYIINADRYLSILQEEAFANLLGNKTGGSDRIDYIFQLLNDDISFLFSKNKKIILKNESEWLCDYSLASTILDNIFNLDIANYPYVHYLYPTMFWVKKNVLERLCSPYLSSLNFQYPTSVKQSDLSSLIRNILPIIAENCEGKTVQLIDNIDSIQDFQFYEDQTDYSDLILDKDIKILSFYLPQFHTIPENDFWHGQGFTEWTKVKSANPLYTGHHQQHIPHEDIGYYILDSPEVLLTQTNMMKKSGMYGQIFYHYWFTGKLILESPAQILLNNKQIEMPFCFCWANENWTKRWDGDDENILLEQNYSAEDAKLFINYLIPFFKDERYINVDNRPLLFIYRPNSIPNPSLYLEIWKEECKKHGLNEPYVVATLTRGATNPQDYRMDAGLERVLHDWTNGNLTNIRDFVHLYDNFQGNILLYDEVVEYYRKINSFEEKKFTYFRSLVPSWDNTARYNNKAYILHGSTPEKFQKWLEEVTNFTKNTLPKDKQFIVINAWNEWAEGDHLEPDTKFGYAYLNCIGRVLSNLEYSHKIKNSLTINSNIAIYVEFTNNLAEGLFYDSDSLHKFYEKIISSKGDYNIQFSNNILQIINNDKEHYKQDLIFSDFVLKVDNYIELDNFFLKNLLKTALDNQGYAVIPNTYGSKIDIITSSNRNVVKQHNIYNSGIILIPSAWDTYYRRQTLLCPEAFCTSKKRHDIAQNNRATITTIIRFHSKANLNELRKALLCLRSMEDCIVMPYIAAQDLNQSQKNLLDTMVDEIFDTKSNLCIIDHYTSTNGNEDLRSVLLNESLRKVKTNLVSFLDYDDVLMPHAFSWLSKRLSNNIAIAFARVYLTHYHSKSGKFIKRYRHYLSGTNYDDFLLQNFAPIHSFMLDLSKINLNEIIYNPVQKYMEDYCLLLQIVTKDNSDWEGVKGNIYIGDYLHAVDREQTLAIIEQSDKYSKLNDPEYIRDNHFVNEVKKRIQTKNFFQ